MLPLVGRRALLTKRATAAAALSFCFTSTGTAALTTPRMTAALSYLSFALKDPSLLPVAEDSGGGAGKTFPVSDPAAGTAQIEDGTAVIARVMTMGRDEARKAIEKSSASLPSWRDGTTGARRAAVLTRWSQLIKDNADDVAKIMTLESGKPLRESLGEVAYGASFLDYFAAEAIRPTSAGGGFLTPTPFANPDGSPRGKVMAIQEAVGVTAMITPWNFPIAMITRKVGPALAAGCTAVVKPSELTPLTALAVKTLADRAGVPEGVLELVTADRDSTAGVGEEFCTNPAVKKISFTGSTPVGKLLMKLSSDTVKRLSLELGGNAVFIAFDDADVDQAVDAAIASKYRNAGQTCVCADRFLVHRSVHDEFVSKLKEKVEKFVVGPGSDGATTMGPVITAAAAESVRRKVEEAVSGGAECVLGGAPLPDLGPNFFQPTIVCDVDPRSRLWALETFGPVVAIRAFDAEEEAVELANDTNAGLASYFCSRDLARVFRVAGRLECGIVGVNDGIISTAAAPFGGVKESGMGREGSAAGIAEYLETKYVFINA